MESTLTITPDQKTMIKVCRIILSCKSLPQLKTACNVMNLYNKLYQPSNFMMELYTQKYYSLETLENQNSIQYEHSYN